jgi:hypothetical protein
MGAEGPCEWRADGLADRVHLIPAQRLRADGLGDHVWDQRVWVFGCRGHHHRFDHGFIHLAFGDLPRSLFHFAHEFAYVLVNGEDAGVFDWRRLHESQRSSPELAEAGAW